MALLVEKQFQRQLRIRAKATLNMRGRFQKQRQQKRICADKINYRVRTAQCIMPR